MIWSVLGALLIGVTLGLLGSGGSILTVPVLVYLLGHAPKSAIAESLAIVAGISVIGLIPFAVARRIQWPTVVYFGTPGMLGTWLGATLGGWVHSLFQLVLFGAVMLAAAALMLSRVKPRGESDSTGALRVPSPARRLRLMIDGVVVGILTGLVGVGGGFLIVPALVLLGGLPIRLAVGTSLTIIALKSAVGFVQYLRVLEGGPAVVDFPTIGLFIAVGAVGSLAGGRINRWINARLLQRLFGVFLLLMGLFVFVREGYRLLTI